jgi:hypothetical protein
MFEEILSQLANRGFYLDHLGQIKEGKEWSATVRKKGTTMMGYGCGTDITKAVRAAIATMKDSFDPKTKPKRRRVR